MRESSKGYFDSIGAEWDGMRESFFPDRVRSRALAAAGVEAGRTAADLGAGTGFIAEGLLGHGLRVVAVDQSPVMLEALRSKFPGRAEMETRIGVAEKLPIEDASVDYCFANMYLHHVDSPARAIGEMARILKPAGQVIVTDLDCHDHAFLREEHHDRWMGFERNDIRRWLRAAGFVDVAVECLGDECCATSNAGEGAAISIFLASAKKGDV